MVQPPWRREGTGGIKDSQQGTIRTGPSVAVLSGEEGWPSLYNIRTAQYCRTALLRPLLAARESVQEVGEARQADEYFSFGKARRRRRCWESQQVRNVLLRRHAAAAARCCIRLTLADGPRGSAISTKTGEKNSPSLRPDATGLNGGLSREIVRARSVFAPTAMICARTAVERRAHAG